MTPFSAMTLAIATLLLALYLLERARRRQWTIERDHAKLIEQFLCASPAAMLVLDAAGAIRYVNHAAARLFSYAATELEGKTVAQLAEANPGTQDMHNIERVLLAPAPHCAAFSITGRTRDGSTFPMQLRTRSICFAGEGWVIVSVRDLSEDICLKNALQRHVNQLLAAKEALQQYNSDLQVLVQEQTAELRIAKDRAEDAKAAQTEFLANMSHELRTPLHGILSFARFGIQKHASADRDKLQGYYQRIETAGQTLLKLLDALLDLSKLEARAVELECEPISLQTLVLHVADEFSVIAREKDLSIEVSSGESEGRVIADREFLSRVIRNVLGNAVKFTPSQGRICVSLDEHDGMVRLSVRDTGPGIPDGECERVFDKFVQSHITKTGAGGTGLGLSICREIVRLHGGSIRAVPTHSRGALLQVCLPLCTSSAASNPPSSDCEATVSV